MFCLLVYSSFKKKSKQLVYSSSKKKCKQLVYLSTCQLVNFPTKILHFVFIPVKLPCLFAF